MWSELLSLEGVLGVILAHALAHRGELTHLVPRRHAALLLLVVHRGPLRFGTEQRIGVESRSTRLCCLVHLVVLPALPYQIAEAALALSALLGLRTLVAKLMLRSSGHSRFAGSGGSAGVIQGCLPGIATHTICIVIEAAFHH